jgi:hypothetical protein
MLGRMNWLELERTIPLAAPSLGKSTAVPAATVDELSGGMRA